MCIRDSTSTDTAEFKQTVKHGTIISDVVLSLLFGVVVHVVWCDLLEEFYILVGMELCHLEP